ncbi:MAG: hypothetical protein ABI273_20480, partial [Lacunisphaera sp.]
GLILLLLILGVGIFAWWGSTRSSAPPTSAQNQSSDWQSAKGQLAANNSQPSANDDHKVGQEGAFSDLSNTIPPPKILHPRHDRTPSEADGVASDHAPQPPEDSAVPGLRVPENKLPADEPSGKPIPRPADPRAQAAREPLNSPSGKSEEKPRSSDEGPGAVPAGDDVKSAKDKLAESPRRATDQRKSGVLGASSPASEEAPDENAASAGNSAPAEATPSTAAASKGGKPSQPAKARASAATGAAANAADADPNADAGSPDSSASGPSSAAGGQSKSSTGKKAKESGKGATAAGAAANSADPAGSGSAGDTPDASTSPEAPAGPGASKKPAAKKSSPTDQVAAQADSSAPPDQTDAVSMPVPSPTAPDTKPAKRPLAKVAEKAGPAATSNELPAAPAEAEADAATEAQPPGPTGNPPPRQRPKAKKKSTSPQSPQGKEPDQAAETESLANRSATIPVDSAMTVAPESNVLLVRTGIVQAPGWKPRMVRDVIVPTRPVTAAEEEAMDTLREKLRREEEARLPKAFQQPRMSGGLVIEFAATSHQQNPPRWREASGAEPAGSKVAGQRAELSWSGGVPPPNTTYTLSDSGGRVMAVASVDGRGGVALKTTAKTNAWYWCGIERTSAAAEASAPLDWQLLSGAAIPASWARDDHWLDGRGQRLEIPLDATTKRVGSYPIALVDPATGWALAGQVVFQ